MAESAQNTWKEKGYLDELAFLCDGLDELQEQFMLPANIRQMIETANNARSMEDFDHLSMNDLENMVHQIRNHIPNVQRETSNMIHQMNRVRTVAFDVDFI